MSEESTSASSAATDPETFTFTSVFAPRPTFPPPLVARLPMEAVPPWPPPLRPPPAPGSVATATPPAPERAVATSPMPPPAPNTSATAPLAEPGPSAPRTLSRPFDWPAYATAAARAAFFCAVCSGVSGFFSSCFSTFCCCCAISGFFSSFLGGWGMRSGMRTFA